MDLPQHHEYVAALVAKTEKVFNKVDSASGIKPIEKLGFDVSNKIRLERSLSWLERDTHLQESDLDLSFICHWIAFEALSSDERVAIQSKSFSNREQFLNFIEKVVTTPRETQEQLFNKRLQADDVWQSISDLFNNPYIDSANWGQFYRGVTKAGKKTNPFVMSPNNKLKKSQLSDPHQFIQISKELIKRLYYLRNLMFHGNSTHKGVERERRAAQLVQGTQILRAIVPVIINIMLDELEDNLADQRWGLIPYPRIRQDS